MFKQFKYSAYYLFYFVSDTIKVLFLKVFPLKVYVVNCCFELIKDPLKKPGEENYRTSYVLGVFPTWKEANNNACAVQEDCKRGKRWRATASVLHVRIGQVVFD